MKKISYINNLDEWREGFSFYTKINIRFSETDMFGHVNNVSPFIYFEEARIEFLKEKGLLEDAMNDSMILVVADLQCDYHEPLFFNDTINMYVKVNELGTTSFDVHYMALNDAGRICLTGRGRIVSIHPKTGKSVALTDSIKEALRS